MNLKQVSQGALFSALVLLSRITKQATGWRGEDSLTLKLSCKDCFRLPSTSLSSLLSVFKSKESTSLFRLSGVLTEAVMLEQRGTPGPSSLQAEPQNPFISGLGSMNTYRHFLCLACRQPADVSSRSSSVIWGKKKSPKTMKRMWAASQFACLNHTHTHQCTFLMMESSYPLTLTIRDPTPATNQSPNDEDVLLVENHSKDSGKDISPIQSPLPTPNLSQCYIVLIVCKLGCN